MRNISDVIEEYLKSVLKETKSSDIIIKRSEVADKFQCVPSQINYVIGTRFTIEKGYEVESKRGGGGYIRIKRIQLSTKASLVSAIDQSIGQYVSQQSGEMIIERLFDAGVITEREQRLMTAVIHRNVLNVELPKRDELRADILRSMLKNILY
ncbi:MAG: CtsR family transcriptional regulator [Bacilli bacterium]